jgi:hypothetical protein
VSQSANLQELYELWADASQVTLLEPRPSPIRVLAGPRLPIRGKQKPGRCSSWLADRTSCSSVPPTSTDCSIRDRAVISPAAATLLLQAWSTDAPRRRTDCRYRRRAAAPPRLSAHLRGSPARREQGAREGVPHVCDTYAASQRGAVGSRRPPSRSELGDCERTAVAAGANALVDVLCQPREDEGPSSAGRAEPACGPGAHPPGPPWRPPRADGALRKRQE